MTHRPLPKPVLSLTIAVAGRRTLGAHGLRLQTNLGYILAAAAKRLDQLRSNGNGVGKRFDTGVPARLTLVTGLADGADQLASRIFLDEAASRPGVEHLVGAILPCNREDFIANSKVECRDQFERLAAAAGFIVELDGNMPPREDGNEASRREAFKAQSEVLLRNADILVAIDDETTAGRVGGTQETIRAALELALPVILVNPAGDVRLPRTRFNFEDAPALDDAVIEGAVSTLVGDLIGIGAPADPDYVDTLIGEYFEGESPRRAQGLQVQGAVPATPWVIRVWTWFERQFKPAGVPPAAGGSTAWDYRLRASALNSYYARLYRGSILVGYGLAVGAVGLAVVSLIILLSAHAELTPSHGAWWALLGLALLKLAALWLILVLVGNANKQRMAERAADYRYLSERLRVMTFLPRLGGLRAPPNPSLPYSTRVASQGVLDHIFRSITRQLRPLEAIGEAEGKVIRLNAASALDLIERQWLQGQVAYHDQNRRTLMAISHWLERWGRRLNMFVIGVVAIDLLILVLGGFHLLPERVTNLLHDPIAPLLVGLTAILPAAVAGLNGVRFQTECARLADRSERMSAELTRLCALCRPGVAGSPRLIEVLHVAEDVARLTLDEVADWSGTYGRELLEM